MDMEKGYKKTILDNGLSIVTDSAPEFYSASIGIWVKHGSLYEDNHENGMSHFVEHMLFKGTKGRSCFEIARDIDSVGGVINAFTSRDTTCFYIKVLSEHIPTACDMLIDIFLNSVFEECEIEREREVILQEIRMVEDTPDDYIHDLLYKTFWGNSSLGNPILGSRQKVSSFSREDLVAFFKKYYIPNSIVVTASGNVVHDDIVERFAPSFSLLSREEEGGGRAVPKPMSKAKAVRKKLEQVHLCIANKGVASLSEKRHAAYILNTHLGGGMSSRLFQEIREKRGLAYNIYSYISTYRIAGLSGLYAGTAKNNLSQVIDLVMDEFIRLKDVPITEEELVASKAQLKSGMLLALESSDSRMDRLANDEICFGRNITVDEMRQDIENVTSQDIMALANELFSPESINLVVLGDVPEKDIQRKLEDVRSML